jgi:hypothetical protein
VSTINSFIRFNPNPGPGSYNPEAVNLFQPSAFSIRKKIKERNQDNVQFPGPGNYEINSAILNEKKVLSTEKKLGCPVFVQPRTKSRKNKTLKNIPPAICMSCIYGR